MELTNTTDSGETFETFCKQLCESCSIVRHLGRDSREFDARPTSINHSWRVYGTSRAQMAEKRCALCRQIRSLAPEVDFIDSVRLYLVEDAVKSVICQGQRTDVFDGLSISIFVLRNSEEPHFDRHFILVCSSLEGFLPVGHFDPGAVDFKLVRSWIESCEAGHSDTCTIAKAYPVHGFQVMDCATGTVVPMLETSTKYAALSYVWGEPKSDEITFPKTVRDAMTAVLALGIRFLWVDRYCIDQTNEDVKQQQIDQMDLIYAQAYFTIIAPEGDATKDCQGSTASLAAHQRFSPWETLIYAL